MDASKPANNFKARFLRKMRGEMMRETLIDTAVTELRNDQNIAKFSRIEQGLVPQPGIPARTGTGTPESIDDTDIDTEAELLKNCCFSKEAQILSIRATDYRILCYFLGLQTTAEIKKATHKDVSLISFLMMESLPRFMANLGYAKLGELNFDCEGNLIPCCTNTWTIHDEEISFINKGFLYFENPKSLDRVVVMNFHDTDHGAGMISAYHKDLSVAKQLIADLDQFTKKNNCLCGAKIRNIDMLEGKFNAVNSTPKHTWDNYYYHNNVIDLFDLEVFGFLRDVEEYNKAGITKRGILLHGRPGTGKTTIGHIICNAAKEYTVIWITPEEVKNNSYQSISLLYKLADYVTPAVVILEDLDLFAEDREGVTDSLRLGSLMNILDGVNSIRNAITVATTNRINLIEQALSNRPGRFDRKVLIDALDKPLRGRMFRDRLRGFEVSDEVMSQIVDRTDDWSGAEVQELINTINLYFIKHREISNRCITADVVDAVISVMREFETAEHGAIGLVG